MAAAVRRQGGRFRLPDLATRYRWTLMYVAAMTTLIVVLLLMGYR